MRYLFVLFLLLAACSTSKRTTQAVDPLTSLSTRATGDTRIVHLLDTLGVHRAPANTILTELFNGHKPKNRGTIIIQTGEKPVAAVANKSKAPIATSQQPATVTATEIIKPKNSAVSTGNYSPATNTTTKKDYSWLIYLLLAGFITFLYYKFKTR